MFDERLLAMPGLAAGDSAIAVADVTPADLVAAQPAVPSRRPGLIRTVWRGLGSAAQWLFGVATLIVGLAVLATIPVLQLLSLGYLLEVSGRIARTGRVRAGFHGVRPAARAGGIVLGIWLLSWPLRFVSTLANEAELIEPGGETAAAWHFWLLVASVLVLCHVVSVCLRGGRFRSFFLPRPILFLKQIFRRDTLPRVRDGLWEFVVGLRLPYYFWLGLRGFAGAVAWLAIPVSLLAVASRLNPGVGVIVGLLGGVMLAFVLMHLPFLQARFAAENRFGAMFELRANRRHFARAPIAYFVALAVTLLLAVPLYLLKIEIVPREAAWLPSLLFVMSMFPARLFTGWACARATKREAPRHWLFRVTSRLAMLPAVGIYVLIVYFTQYLSWYGVWSLYEQHAFLLPVPFLGL